MRWMLAAAIAIAPAICHATQAYKCVDARGHVTFASTPCPGGSGSASVVEARNTPPGGRGAAYMPTPM